MLEHKIFSTQVMNWGPGFIANVWLNTPPGFVCRQILFKAPPEWVDRVELKMRGYPIVDVGPYTDEDGITYTAGQRLATLNGYAGLHLTGGDFSILLSDLPFGGLSFPPESAPYCQFHVNKLGKPNHQMSVDLVCHRMLPD